MSGPTVTVRYPFAPLAALMGISEHAACLKLNLGGRTQQEYRTLGMSEKVADRMASRAGFHPASVWPEWLDEATERASKPCVACRTPFVPSRVNHRYCSPNCRWRVGLAKRRARSARLRRANRNRARAYRAHARAAELRRRGERVCAADDCDASFVPVPSNKQFCSKRCCGRIMQRRYKANHLERVRSEDRKRKRRGRAPIEMQEAA